MILCDGGCQRAYHLECINLTEVPDNEWLCPSCSRQKNMRKISSRSQKSVEEESDEYFETKKERKEKNKLLKKKIKTKEQDEAFQMSRKPTNRQALVNRDYSGIEGKLIPCPEGCGAKASTRTSLLSHAYILIEE